MEAEADPGPEDHDFVEEHASLLPILASITAAVLIVGLVLTIHPLRQAAGNALSGCAHASTTRVFGSSVATRGPMILRASLAPAMLTPGRRRPNMFIHATEKCSGRSLAAGKPSGGRA